MRLAIELIVIMVIAVIAGLQAVDIRRMESDIRNGREITIDNVTYKPYFQKGPQCQR